MDECRRSSMNVMRLDVPYDAGSWLCVRLFRIGGCSTLMPTLTDGVFVLVHTQ